MSFYHREPPDPDTDGSSPPEDEHRYLCACGDPTCWCDDRDTTNVRIGREWYSEGCAANHPMVCGDVMAGIKADERQDAYNERLRAEREDDFNRSRR